MSYNFDWSDIQTRAAISLPVSLFLSPTSQAMALDAINLMHDTFRWRESYAIDFDELEAALAQATYELMKPAMIGMIFYAAGTTPTNALYCDGATYDVDDYPLLAAALDPLFVSGSTFTVPDLRNLIMRGDGDNDVGDAIGDDQHTLTVAEIPSHTHTNTPHSHLYTPPTINIDIEGVGVPDPIAAGLGLPTNTGTSGVVIDNTGGGDPHNNIPASYTLRPCIVAL